VSDVAIRVDRLGKRYRLGTRAHYDTLREALVRGARAALGHGRAWLGGAAGRAPGAGELWALREVTFDVKPGEVVGVVGRNGSGKSTLLRVLSRITEPTEGRGEIRGRVGSLLEVGTGFHPELTGRENIYLNAALIGMRRAEIARKFDEIVAFAETERFLDTPVKRYSSGMYVRLAFAVAAHLEPEIMLVDEVLAVGDAAFQRKCLGKMGDVARAGRTVLFVSHNMAAVQSLCSRALWLDGGGLAGDGAVDAVVGAYLRRASAARLERAWGDPAAAPATEDVRLVRVGVRPAAGGPDGVITVRTPFDLDVEFCSLRPGVRWNVSVSLFDQAGVCVLSSPSVTDRAWFGRPYPAGRFRSRCRVPAPLLNDGLYRLSVLLVQDAAHPVLVVEDAITFEVHDAAEGRGGWYGRWPGVVRPELAWATERLDGPGEGAP
jgi:lipopolysaccharide transport system ATP-binding protein